MEAKTKGRLSLREYGRNMGQLYGGSVATSVQRIIEEMQTARLLSIREYGVIATCVEGRIWITRDGDRNEKVLAAGESFATPDRNRVILQALAPSRVSLERAAKSRPFHSTQGRVLSLFAAVKAAAITFGKRLAV